MTNENNSRGKGLRNSLKAGLIVPVLLVLVGCSPSPEELMAEAQEQIADNRYVEASISLKRLLQDSPQDLEGRLLLAEVSLALNDPLAADKEFTRARDLGAETRNHMRLYQEILLTLDRNTEALELLARPLEDIGLQEADVLVFKGRALLNLGNSIEAERAFSAALEIDSTNVEAEWGIASSRAARGEKVRARELLDSLVERNPDFAKAWLLLGELSLRDGRLEEAATEFERGLAALESRADRRTEGSLVAGTAEVQMALDDLEGAQASVNRLRSILPRSPATPYLVAKLAAARGEYDVAANELETILNVMPNNVPALMLYGSISLAKKDFAQAESVFRQVVSRHPDNMVARRLLAAAQMQLSDPAGAVQTLTPVLESAAGNAQLSVLASRALISSGSREQAIALLEEALANEPENLDILLNLSSAYLSVGRPQDAIRLAETIPPDNEDYQRELILALAYSATEDTAAAERQIAAIMANHGDDVGALSITADFYLSQGDIEKARRYFEQALALDRSNVPVLLGLARVHARTGEKDLVAQRYAAVLEIEPGNVLALTELAQINASSGDLAASISLLERAIDSDAVSPVPRFMLARALIQQGDLVRAEQLARDALRLAPESGITQAEVGGIFLETGKHTEALAYLRRAIDLDPESPAIWFLLARAQIALGETADARSSLSQSLALDPTSLNTNLMLALMELKDGNLQRALDIATDMTLRYPDSAGPRTVRGDALLRMEQFEQAYRSYQEAYDLAPSGRIAQSSYQAAKAADMEEPEQILQVWTSANPDDWGSLNLLAMHYEEAGDYDGAIAAYEKAIKADADNVVALNNLANRYIGVDVQRALELAERAYAIRPDAPTIADTLGWARARSGDLAGGLTLLEGAAQRAPNVGDIQYHLAYVRNELGDAEGSAAILRRVIEVDQEFAERANAIALLEELENDD